MLTEARESDRKKGQVVGLAKWTEIMLTPFTTQDESTQLMECPLTLGVYQVFSTYYVCPQ